MKQQKIWFVVPYALWIVLFVVAPLVLILYQSFFNINGQFTFGNYQSYLTSNVYLRMTFNSVWYAFLITLITLLISYPAAYVINRLPNRQFWLLLVILPTWINLLLKTYAFIGLFSQNGSINQFLRFVGLGSHQILFTDASFIFVAAYIEIPFMILPIFNLIGGNRVITLGTAIEEHFLTTQNWGMGSTIGVVLIIAMFIVMFATGDRQKKKGGRAK